jgi:hypothetical protein
MGLDKDLSDALDEAASDVQTDIDRFGMYELLEADLRGALRRALHERLPGSLRIERGFPLPGWKGRVGGVDLVVETDGAATHAFELKFTRSLAGVLWDLLKLASIDAPGLRRFVVAAAPRGLWDLAGTTAGVLRDGCWETRAILEQHAQMDWQAWLRNWQTRPLRLPAEVRTTLRAEATLRDERGEEWPLRTVEVEPVGDERIALAEDGRVLSPSVDDGSTARGHE